MSGLLRKLLVAGFGLALLGLLAVAGLFWHIMRWADQPLAADDASKTHIALFEAGGTLSSFAAELEQQQLLDGPQRLLLLGRLTGLDTQLQAGEYRIDNALTPRELLIKLNRGDVVTYEFRIEEGGTVAQMLNRLAQHDALTHRIQARDAAALQAELGLSTTFAEGMFFPDTYQYRRGDTDRDLLLRAHQAMLAVLDQTWQARAEDLQINTIDEMVILASIIEKESGLETDRGMISQVFHNRLAKRMLLQTDPTVIYALGDAFDGNLIRAHLRIDSPFNTYRYRGLPPTPIALPSAAALQAAVQPTPGDYFYFVARGDGSSQFSRTLAEHNRAVRKYQLGQ